MTDIPQAALDAIDAEDTPWPSLGEWKAAARTDGAGPDARRKVLLHGAQLAAPHIAAAERQRLLSEFVTTEAIAMLDVWDVKNGPEIHGTERTLADHLRNVLNLLTEGTTT